MSRVEEALKLSHKYNGHKELTPAEAGDVLVAASILADEYVKLRDSTPITEEFAAKVQSRNVGLIDTARGWNLRMILFDGDNHCWWFTDVIVSTCGQVRCLLLAAGIECDA